MKHIVFVLPTLGGGGAERTVIGLANGLAVQGYQVSLLVASLQGDAGRLRAEVSDQVSLVNLECGRVILLLSVLPEWLKRFKPDILISSQTHVNLVCYMIKRISGFNGRLILREVSTPSINLGHFKRVKKWLIQGLMRYVYQRADHVVAVSDGVASDLKTYLRCDLKRLTVIYNPVVTPILYERARESLNDPWFAKDRVCPVILAVGRLTEAKNYPLLLQAFALVLKQKPAHLVVLGEGEERPQLEAQITELGLSGKVRLDGFDSNPLRYMARCDVYVMTSRWEGLPGALIQALALGARVVSTDCPSGPREILQDGKLGILVESGQVKQLAKALLDVLMREHSIEFPAVNVEKYTLEHVLVQYRMLFGGNGVAVS